MRKNMMKFKSLLFLFTATALLVAACSSLNPSGVGEAVARASQETALVKTRFSDCPVTQTPQPAFVPPDPWPEVPPDKDRFWYGDRGLWTALPLNGSWPQLALGEKFWWWSEEFDVSQDATPDLIVTARRLDGQVPSFQVSEATNGYHQSFHWAMLVGVELSSPGCWEFTGQYKGHQLSFILWVPAE
jgi:predicted small secreted protein